MDVFNLEKLFAEHPSYFKDPKKPTKEEIQRFIKEKPELAAKLKAALELRGGLIFAFLAFLAYQVLK